MTSLLEKPSLHPDVKQQPTPLGDAFDQAVPSGSSRSGLDSQRDRLEKLLYGNKVKNTHLPPSNALEIKLLKLELNLKSDKAILFRLLKLVAPDVRHNPQIKSLDAHLLDRVVIHINSIRQLWKLSPTHPNGTYHALIRDTSIALITHIEEAIRSDKTLDIPQTHLLLESFIDTIRHWIRNPKDPQNFDNDSANTTNSTQSQDTFVNSNYEIVSIAPDVMASLSQFRQVFENSWDTRIPSFVTPLLDAVSELQLSRIPLSIQTSFLQRINELLLKTTFHSSFDNQFQELKLALHFYGNIEDLSLIIPFRTNLVTIIMDYPEIVALLDDKTRTLVSRLKPINSVSNFTRATSNNLVGS